MRQLSAKAIKIFGFARIALLSFEDFYAVKICAALDRQHPRDLYDVYWLLQHEGIYERLKNAFLVYLMGHNRPMAELLAPQAQDIEPLYRAEFEGMIYEPVGLERLQETLKQLVREIHNAVTDEDRHFLLALKQGTQDWRNFSLPEVGAATHHPVEDAQPGAHEPVQTSAGCDQTRKNLSKIKTG